MKKLIIVGLIVTGGFAFAQDKVLKEVTLDELDEITGGGVRDPKIILWDEAHKNTGINPEINSGATGNSATYRTSVGNEVSMR